MELTRIWDVIRRRKWVIIQALVLITLVAVAGSYMITPAYEASSQIMIKQPKKSGIDMGRLFQSKNINIGLSGLSTIITTSPGVDINKILATSRPIINRMVWKLQLRDGTGDLVTAQEETVLPASHQDQSIPGYGYSAHCRVLARPGTGHDDGEYPLGDHGR
jgi:uncharacterized protein involved in exopolysaccharide biosynthesis